MKLVLLSLFVAGSAFAATPTTTTTTPTTMPVATAPAPSADGKVHFTMWVTPDQITAPLQLVNLEKTHPELFDVEVNYVLDANSPITPTTLWKTAYVNKYERARLAEWLQCLVYDTEAHTCATLLNINFKPLNSKEKELKALAKANWTKATELGARTVVGTWVNGTRYDLPLAYGQLLNEVNPLLPKDKQLVGMTKYETTKMYAIGNETGFGTYDTALEKEFKRWIPNLQIEKVPANTKRAAELLTKAELPYVPAYVFDKASVRNSAVQRLTTAGRAKIMPSGFGYFDFKGQTTELRFIGEEKPNTLDLWVMSQCPYGVKAEKAYQAAVNQKLANPNMKVNLRYIVSQDPKTKALRSLHGEEELQEDIRQLAIQKTWPEMFWKYLEARNVDLKADWKTVATTAGLNPTEVEAKMPVGKKLLAQDIKEGAALKVSGSPTYLWQNRIILNNPEEFTTTIGYNPTTVQVPAAPTTTTRQPGSKPAPAQAAAAGDGKCG